MKSATVILGMLVAMTVAAPASAHLITTSVHCKKLPCVAKSQLKNLKHARYVCHQGAHYAKRWNCQAVRWLQKEYNETQAAMRPRVPVAVSSGYAPLCGSSCVACESGHNPNAWNAAGYWGLYQFDYGTWVAHGGAPSSYGHASAGEQTAVASRIRYDAWPNC